MSDCSVYVWRVAVFIYKGLGMCSILVGLVISNDTPAAYFVLFLLRNKRIHFSFNVWMCGCVNVWIGNVPVEPSSKFSSACNK